MKKNLYGLMSLQSRNYLPNTNKVGMVDQTRRRPYLYGEWTDGVNFESKKYNLNLNILIILLSWHATHFGSRFRIPIP